MDQILWRSVDAYFEELLVLPDVALNTALQTSDAAGLPRINVTSCQGKLLQILAEIQRAKAILEIGTLGGYSTIWFARALPADGRLVTLEINPEYAAIAMQNIARAGFAHLVDIRTGVAIESMEQLVQEGTLPFDLIFIDADKSGNPAYLEWSIKLSRPGTVIICDNVVRQGAVLDSSSTDPDVTGTRRFCEMVAGNPALTATAIQTVGSKGYDGFVIARVNDKKEK
jgi:predicted O-methyltransferase YrrM